MSLVGRFAPEGLEWSGRSGYEVAQYQHVGQLSCALLTLMAAPAACMKPVC